MKLCIQQKIFSWNDKFKVMDITGEDRYYAEGEIFSWAKKLHVYDMNQNEVAFIQQKILSWLPRFFVFIDGKQVAEIVKEFSLFRPKYRIDGLGWRIDGDFWEHNYTILEGNRQIVSIKKEWLTWGDCYTLDLEDEKNTAIILAVVLAIDCVLAAETTAATSGNA